MRRWAACVGILVLAGCVDPADGNGEKPATLGACDLRYPDNSTFDCTTSVLIDDGILNTRPTLEDGWFCHAHNRNDDGYGVVELHMSQDGRLGFWWTSSWTRPGGVMYAQASVFYGPEDGDVAIVVFKPQGFVELPFKARGGTGDVHLLVRHHVLDVKVGEGDWHEDKNATMLVGSFGGDPWYVWQYEVLGETRFLDTMVHAPDDGSTYAVRNQFFETDDHAAFATASAWGAKFLQIPMTLDVSRHASCQV